MSEQQNPTAILLTEWQIECIKKATEEAEPIFDWLIRNGLVAPYCPTIPRHLPTDPRERALYLRKHRNTGPSKPIQEQRRKR